MNKNLEIVASYLEKNKIHELEEFIYKNFENSDDINVLLIKAYICKIKGKKYEALMYYRIAYQLDSNNANLLGNLANFLFQMIDKNHKLINAFYKKALSYEPNNKLILKNYAIYKLSTFKVYEAINIFKTLISNNLNDIEILIDYGICLYHINKNFESIEYFKKALQIDKNSVKALYNFSLVNLRLENFEVGFNLYKLRFSVNQNLNNLFQHIPELNNLNLIKNNKVLIWAEQGFGDAIQFSQILNEFNEIENNITFFCHSELITIFKESFNNIIVTSELSNSEKFDFQISLISLLELVKNFKKYLRNINPFLKINKDDISSFFLSKNTKKITIGISFEGNNKHSNNLIRNIPLKKLLFLRKYANLIILQKNIKPEDLYLLNENNLINYGPFLNSFNQTANIIKNCDLIVSVDTAIVHLSGSIGVKTVCLLPLNSDWRWGENSTLKIYTTVTQLKQKYLGNWDNVIDELELFIKKEFEKKS